MDGGSCGAHWSRLDHSGAANNPPPCSNLRDTNTLQIRASRFMTKFNVVSSLRLPFFPPCFATGSLYTSLSQLLPLSIITATCYVWILWNFPPDHIYASISLNFSAQASCYYFRGEPIIWSRDLQPGMRETPEVR
jgi:hypothetical protein